jgi:hypothetical protein
MDEERDQLLRELVGAVVVGAVRDDEGQPVRIVISPHEMVGRCLGCGIGTMWIVPGLFGEEGIVELQRTVHLISRDVVKKESGTPLHTWGR